ncbi:Pycsar system effector family protein [Galbibacter pacificus]|uniref:DUF5706 domain-containing protein n=1 Tax=Galbibacter pacificus TaxID=2996052 RepID=A0ABT6FPL8_9FLAO|nr:Pycsar system effector family protein [Galbibacter pacificus]MDG3582318.1 DUF5706 domain-containing protein [Galbibacter pacificus]MDG3585206.1 DUF5706 domain-containing protein [Galbibacter pacificus]
MNDIVDKSSDYVKNLLITKLGKNYLYHNLIHTERVVSSAKKLCEALKISAEDEEIIMLAAWFHDTGYTQNPTEHERESCKIAKQFLEENGYNNTEKLNKVCSTIMATKMGALPQNILEKIIKDADSSHLSKESYVNTSEILRQELAATGVADFSMDEWRNKNIKLFATMHQYYTAYAIENWSEGKINNLNQLIKKNKKDKQKEKNEKLKAKLKQENPERGVQTLYRVALRNHIQLSSIADTKANILLSINAIIISLALSNLIPKLDSPSNSHLVLPTLVLVIFSVISVVFAILSTKPNVTRGEFTDEDVAQRKVNLLFFGNFHKVPYKKYESVLREMTKEKEYIYESLTMDLYNLGLVLAKKYKLLRITYMVFMVGLILSVFSFIIAFSFI